MYELGRPAVEEDIDVAALREEDLEGTEVDQGVLASLDGIVRTEPRRTHARCIAYPPCCGAD